MPRRSTLGAHLALVFLVLPLLAGCGDDGGGPGDNDCANCDSWTRLTIETGQFPAAHPSRVGVVAYSSRQGDPEVETADIWIREAVSGLVRFHQITNDPGDERLPSWSPDGRRLAFSRFSESRYDIWIVDVTSFPTPTDLRKVTTPELVTGYPGRSSWKDDETLIFTNGDDIYELSLSAGASGGLVELVPDPSDVILGLGQQFVENQPNFVKAPSGRERLAFISDLRGPQGNIAVTAFAETGEPIIANISIDSKPLLNPDRDTLQTPFNVFGIAPGLYTVAVATTGGQDGLCDTSLSIPNFRVRANEVESADFFFERPRGAIRILAPTGQTARIIIDGPGGRSDFGSVQAETTTIGCLFAGDYRVELVSAGITKDSVTVEVCERSISEVCVTTALGGCPEPRAQACLDTLIYEPADTVGAAGAAMLDPDEMPTGKAPPSLQTPALAASDLWVYNFDDDTFQRLTNDIEDQDLPAWSPDGRFLAYIEVTGGIRTLRIMNVESRGITSVPLPGRTGTRICTRVVGQPSWLLTGEQIAVSLSNCSDEIEEGEQPDIWVVNVGGLLPP